MSDPILDDLNPEQRQAVAYGEGPLMVLAGAGSGKTRVITRRIARLLRDGALPSEILALTFTNKAAGEMAHRVQALGGEWVHVATFHSACARFLRHDGHHVGYPRDYSIYDTYDRDSCLKSLMAELQLDERLARPADVGRRISWLKNVRVTPADFVPGLSEVDDVVTRVWPAYDERLRRMAAMDFDDLLLRFVELLEQHPDVAERYRERFRWLLIDEFQDTNRIQYDLVRLLAGERHNVCVVGDPDQSIYRFRGAEVRNMLEFEQDFAGTTVIVLEQNYRSTKRILQAAEGVIERNRERKQKRLRTDNPEGDLLVYRRAESAEDEAREIGQDVHGLLRSGVPASEIAIFYRAHFLSRTLESALRWLGVAYHVVGGLSFFERREIKDLLAYLRVLLNPLDDTSMERIVNVPPRGIGKATLDKLRARAAGQQMSLREAVGDPEVRAAFGPKQRKAMDRLAEVLDTLTAMRKRGAGEVLERLLEEIDYMTYACGLGDPEDVSREENILELVHDAVAYDGQHGGGLSGYLQHVSLMTDEDRGRRQGPSVAMMTVHAAKGLEFDHVFVAGMEEGLFPHSRSVDSPADMEEERRLMYVALTRARRTVVLSGARFRFVAGESKAQHSSRFLSEIPDEAIERLAGGGRFDDGDDVRGYRYDLDEPDYRHEDGADGDGGEEGSNGHDAAAIPVELAAGDRVVHPVYGPGTVLGLSGRGIQARARVTFDSGEERVLMLEYANLDVGRGEAGW